MSKKNVNREKLIIYREGEVDKRFDRGITLFTIITLIALFGLFIALNNMVNAQKDLEFRNKAYGVCESRITMLQNDLSSCNANLVKCNKGCDSLSYLWSINWSDDITYTVPVMKRG